MPDSFHPGPWGHQPFDERDLDALLGGNVTDVPVALRPVADALDALVAAPSPAELRGEAAIRAQFLAQRQRAGQEQVPGGEPGGQAAIPSAPSPSAPSPSVPSAVPVQAAGTPSVPFPVPTEPIALRGGPANPARPRRGRHARRGPARPGASRPAARARRHRRGRIAAAVTAGAALAVFLAATYTGALPGPAQRLAHITIAAPAGRTYAGRTPGPGAGATSAPATPSTGITGAGAPSATMSAPTASPSGTPDQVALCDAFLPVAEHPAAGQASWRSTEYARLVSAAGGQRQVYSYCAPVWDRRFPSGYPKLPAYPPYFPHPGGGETGPGPGGAGQQPGEGTVTQEPSPPVQPSPASSQSTSSQSTGSAPRTPIGSPGEGSGRPAP
ncbi:MAG TPA: hypothetical protein VGG75_40020 [Trebonia sp.]|jgi:hypothetical protein